MNKKTVAILGCSGMLGSMVIDVFSKDPSIKLISTVREKKSFNQKKYPHAKWKILDAEKATIVEIAKVIQGAQWVVNAIGIIKPYIHDDNPKETERAICVNSLFPHLLSLAAQKTKTKVLQIATDCVYSGQKGGYIETDFHDALDVYGKTKSLGEAYYPNINHLRCSIIGPELKAHLSLMDWFLGQTKKAEVNGFTNHQWNGVTTLHFARICQGMIKKGFKLPHIQHVVPGNSISKAKLLKSFAREFKRLDIIINPTKAPVVIDRTLSTNDEKINLKIWKSAGYKKAPTVEEMIAELAKYKFSL